MRAPRRLGLLVIAAALSTALVGCGSDDDGGSGGDESNGVAAKSAQEILTDAKAALRSVKSFHMTGSGSQGEQSFAVDLRVDVTTNNGEGVITMNGTDLDMIRIGDALYVRAPGSYYTENGAPPAIAELAGDEWIEATATAPEFASVSNFTDVDALLEPDGEITKGEETTKNGEAVIELRSSEGSLFVRTTGEPVPVAIEQTGGNGTLAFSEFGVEVAPTAPEDTVDLSELGG